MKNLLIIAMLSLLVGCASGPIVDHDSSVDFAQYKKFAFISDNPLLLDDGAATASPMLEGKLVMRTEAILIERGYERVGNRSDADFVIGFTVGARDKIRVDTYPEYYRPAYPRWRWGGAYYRYEEVDVDQYVEGTLALDIYDVAERKPVWHGVATRRVSRQTRENSEEAIDDVLTELFDAFPPESSE